MDKRTTISISRAGCREPLASNVTPDSGVPVVIERPETFPFAPGEREQDWHVATDAELQAYEDHHNAEYDRLNALTPDEALAALRVRLAQ